MSVYRVGTASWTDPTLLSSDFYPPQAKTAEDRLRFYSTHFDTVEVDSTFYALPSERNASLWAARTPPGFVFHVKAFALLTGHAAEVRALPLAVRGLLSPEAARLPRLQNAEPHVVDLCFEMFRGALAPLRTASKMGCILLQFPPWFAASVDNEARIDACRRSLADDAIAVEFRHRSWFDGRTARTLDFLRDRDLTLVCTDAPRAPSIPNAPYTATNETAYVRLHGRNRTAWFQRGPSAAQRFKYLYSDAELRTVAGQIRELRAAAVHVLFNNCYANYGVRNAAAMKALLA